MTTKTPDNSLTFGNIPDDYCCPDDCPYLDDYPCDECDYDDYLYDRKMDEADRKFDEKRDRELED